MVKLSVVIPHLNYGRYLRECLDSVYAQTFKDYEVILVDGGSTDNTSEVLRDFPDVKVIEDVPPQGCVRAVNKGIDLMHGDFFHQLNSDCRLMPTMYEDCLEVLEGDDELGMVYTSWHRIDDEGKFLGCPSQPKRFSRNRLLYGNFIDSSSMVIRRSCFDLVGVFDPRCPWSMDWIMATKISSAFRVAFLDKPLFDYRVHSGQVTEEKSVGEYAKALNIVRGYFGCVDWVRSRAVLKVKGLAKKVLK